MGGTGGVVRDGHAASRRTASAARGTSVLHLIKGLGPGGAEHLVLGAVRARGPRIGQVDVAYLLPHKAHLVPALEEAGARAHCLRAPDVRDVRWTARLAKLLRRHRYDVVHVHSPLVGALARPLLRASWGARRPVVVTTEHNSWASHAPATRWANRVTYRMADAWIAVSDAVRDSLPPELRERTEVVVHGVEVETIRRQRSARGRMRRELGLGDDQVVAVTVANLRRQKAYPDLLAAAHRVVADHPHVVFLSVGQGPLEHELRALHASLGLGDRFRFLGHRTDVAAVMAAADVFVLASHHEGYPLAVMEAAAAGLPVVATAVGGVPTALAHGESGLLVQPSDIAGLARAIATLCTDADLRARLAAHSSRRADRFDIAAAIGRVEAIYERALANRSRSR